MKAFVLLFRGINVGGKNLLPMKELKAALESKCFQQVSSYIQSGNVVLETSQNASAIASSVSKLVNQQFGFTPAVMVLDKIQFANAVNNNPYPECEGKSVHFYFCADKPTLAADKIAAVQANDEDYELHGKVFYLHAPSGIGRSKLAAKVEACLGVPVTARNLNTVQKIQQMLEAG